MEQNQTQTLELVLQELQNRIGQITTEYETRVAVLKAQATQELQSKDQRINELINALAESRKPKDATDV
jgi:GAF domain-containing protein